MIERPLEPQESKYKCYAFKGTAICTIKGFVWAKSEQEAIELASTGGYEEIDNTEIEDVLEIYNVEEY